jgi:hypothetical protein
LVLTFSGDRKPYPQVEDGKFFERAISASRISWTTEKASLEAVLSGQYVAPDLLRQELFVKDDQRQR